MKFLQSLKTSAADAFASVRNLPAKVGAFAMVVFAGSSQAALTLSTTEIVADIATVVAFITVIGLAVLGMVFVARAIKWARRAG